jgi:hypothetical protein
MKRNLGLLDPDQRDAPPIAGLKQGSEDPERSQGPIGHLVALNRHGFAAPATFCRNSIVSIGPRDLRSTPATPGTT